VFNALHGLSDKRGSIGSLPFGNDSALRGENILSLLSLLSSDVSMVFNQSSIPLCFLEGLLSITFFINSSGLIREKKRAALNEVYDLCMSIIYCTVSEIKAFIQVMLTSMNNI